MIKPLFFGSVSEQGTLILGDPSRFKAYLLTLKGKEVQLSIKRYELTRSNQANKYYWAVVIAMVSEAMGIIPDEAHDYCKSLFLKEGVEVKGKRYEIIRSTANLPSSQFWEYVEKIKNWAGAELEIAIPEPSHVEY